MQRINSKQKGITLIALVVTVILLLILAGVTINGFLGDGGFLKTVTDNQKAQRIETTRTKIEIIVTNHVTQKTLNDNVTEDDLFQDLIDGDIAESRDDITGTNGKYEVTTKDGDIFEIIIEENGDVKVEYIGDKEGGIIKIGDIQITEITNKTVSVKTNIRNPEGEYSYTYSYKKNSDKEYTTAKENTTSNTFTFTNLEPGTKYDIKVTVAHSKGTTDMYATTTTSSKITPTIVIEKGNVTTNSIAVTVKVTEAPEKLPTTPSYHYYIKKSQEEYNQEANHTGTETTNTFANLTQGTSYDIKVTTKDLENNEVIATLENVTTGTVGGATGNLQSGNLIASSPKWNPSTHTATVDLTTPTNLIIQWQKNGIAENGWTTSNTATDLKHGDTLYARLTDGKNAGKEAGVTILDDTDPTITVTRQGVTTKSITVNVASSDAQSGMPTNPTYNYYIKKSTTGSYPTSVSSSGTNTSYTFDNLDANTSYDIQVTAADAAGRTGTGTLTGITTNTIAGATAGLKSGAITAGSPNWNPSSHTASITLSTTTGLTIQWQKNSISESGWTTSDTATGLAHGDTLYARLTDGKNSGQHAGISILDGNNPEPAVINDLPSTANPGATITANITHTDNQSGIDLSSCKWIFNTTSGNLGTTNSAWNTATSFGNSNSINITVPNAGGTSYYLHVLSVDMAGNKRESTSSAVTINSALVADGTFSELKGVNTPKIGTGMTPIKWNGERWINTTEDDPDWYDYSTTEKKWANAKTSDGSMWVWIPRYAYQISSGYHSDTTGTINIKFMKGIGQEAADGTTTWDNMSGQGNWNIHPGFEYDVTKPGIWVAKFEASQNDAGTNAEDFQDYTGGTSGILKIQPGVNSWRNISVSKMYDICINYNTVLKSHLMKNMEWGAVAYLSQSSYGKNSKVELTNCREMITGAGPDQTTEASYLYNASVHGYTTSQGQKASTTGNVWGIYDMNGGAMEHVAMYVKTEYIKEETQYTRYTEEYGKSLIDGVEYTKDVYETSQSDPFYLTSSRYGDALWETATDPIYYYNAKTWYGGSAYMPRASYCFGVRGGNSSDLFGIFDRTGEKSPTMGFRPVLAL